MSCVVHLVCDLKAENIVKKPPWKVSRQFAPMSNSPHLRKRQLAPYQVLVPKSKAHPLPHEY